VLCIAYGMSNRSIYINGYWLAAVVLLLVITTVTTNTALAENPGPAASEAVSPQKGETKLANRPIYGDNGPKNAKNAQKTPKLPAKSIGTRGDPNAGGLVRQMMALVVVILALGGVGWVVSKKVLPRLKGQARPGGKAVRILETTYISPRQPVYLLAVGSKKLLIACGKDGPRLLADVTAGLARSAGCDESFADVLDNQTEVSE